MCRLFLTVYSLLLTQTDQTWRVVTNLLVSWFWLIFGVQTCNCLFSSTRKQSIITESTGLLLNWTFLGIFFTEYLLKSLMHGIYWSELSIHLLPACCDEIACCYNLDFSCYWAYSVLLFHIVKNPQWFFYRLDDHYSFFIYVSEEIPRNSFFILMLPVKNSIG